MEDDSAELAAESRRSLPLYIRIIIGMLLGVSLAMFLSPRAGQIPLPGGGALRVYIDFVYWEQTFDWIERIAKLVLRLLSALAPPLILVAIVHALMTAEIQGKQAFRLAGLLILNTLVAIAIGLFVANLVQPGRFARMETPAPQPVTAVSSDPLAQRVVDIAEEQGYQRRAGPKKPDPLISFLDNVPDSLLRPFVESGKTIGVILIAIAFGIAFRRSRTREVRTLEDLVGIAYDSLLTMLHWIIALVPYMVFGIVTSLVAKNGFQPFVALGGFVLAVILALTLQACYYLIRVWTASWVNPLHLLRGVRDALVLAFSTASSTATMPVTYACLRDRVRVREQSASLGALVGANFNNDGTALYEAMSALFISQMIGQQLSLQEQLVVAVTSVAASVGAAGIPEAGIVTMTLVFAAVGLPVEYIAILLTVDWFLDRCRTAINVMGDTNVACILDGRTPPTFEETAGA